MKIAGLTGGIGSGKSTVDRMLEARGARVVDADQVAREVVMPDLPAWREIVAAFGPSILNPDRTLNREALAAVVFGQPDQLALLNRITHPRIGDEVAARLRRWRDEGVPLAVIDAALLLESPATSWVRPVIVVTAEEEVRARRVVERDRCAPADARRRISAQWSDAERIKSADFVIDNSGGLDALEARWDEVWRALMADAGGSGIIKADGSGR